MEIERKSIEGIVILKRKSRWVKRYAEIKNSVFQYKKDKAQIKFRNQINLQKSIMQKGKAQKGQNIIRIQPLDGNDSLMVSFDDEILYQKWLQVFIDAKKTDEEIKQSIKESQIQQIDQLQSSQIIVNPLKEEAKKVKAKTEISRFSGNQISDNELTEHKKRLKAFQDKQWILSETKESLLVYTDKKILFSSTIPVIEQMKQILLLQEKTSLNQKSEILISLLLFVVYISLEYVFKQYIDIDHLSYIRSVVSLLLFMSLVLMLRNKKAHNIVLNPKINIKENFDIKVVTYLTGSPDEIANSLMDEKQREMWDPSIKTMSKIGNEKYKIIYQQHDPFNGSYQEVMNKIGIDQDHQIYQSLDPIIGTYKEDLQYQCISDKEGQYFVAETVNENQYRYYELAQVQNRPYFMRLTAYMSVNPQLFQKRGKDIYRRINGLRNFVQQSNRQSEISIVLKKHSETENGNEMIASLRNTMFTSDVIEEIGEIIEQSEIIVNDDGCSEEEEKKNGNSIIQNGKKEQIIEQSPLVIGKPIIIEDLETPQKLVSIESINNWQERIQTYDEERQTLMRQALDKMKQFDQYMAYNDWKDLVNDRKQGVLIQTRTSDSGLTCVKSTGIINHSTDDIFLVIGDSAQYRKEYDLTYDSGHFVKKISQQVIIIYQKTKKVLVVSPRDLIMLLIYDKLPNGDIKVVVSSIENSNLIPESKGIIRAFVHIGGWYLENIDGNSTNATFLSEADLKGSIPGFALTQANKDQGYQVSKIRNSVAKLISQRQ